MANLGVNEWEIFQSPNKLVISGAFSRLKVVVLPPEKDGVSLF